MEATALLVREHELAPELRAQRDGLIVWARELAVATVNDCRDAESKLVIVMALRKAITQDFEPSIEAAMESKRKAEAARKTIAEQRDRHLAPLVEVSGLVGQKVLSWRQEQEKRAEAELARQLAEARKAAEDAQLAAAQAAKDAGDSELADTILNEPPTVTMPVSLLPPELATPDRTVGLRRVLRPVADILDPRACATWCAQNNMIPHDVLMTCIGPTVRAQRESCTIPGVRVRMVETMESTGGR